MVLYVVVVNGYLESIQIFFEVGVDFNGSWYYCSIFVYYVFCVGWVDILKVFIRYGVDVDVNYYLIFDVQF